MDYGLRDMNCGYGLWIMSYERFVINYQEFMYINFSQ